MKQTKQTAMVTSSSLSVNPLRDCGHRFPAVALTFMRSLTFPIKPTRLLDVLDAFLVLLPLHLRRPSTEQTK